MDKQQRYELYRFSVGAGWWPILDKYLPKILAEDPDVQFYIKEKYGLLRIEMSSKVIPIERHIELENAAELESAATCECCGRPGRLRDALSWMLTLCDDCYNGGRRFRDAMVVEAEKKWMAGETLYAEKYAKPAAPFRWNLKNLGVDFEIDDELHGLFEAVFFSYVSAAPSVTNDIYRIHIALAERLADGRLTNDQVGILFRKFVREASEWVI